MFQGLGALTVGAERSMSPGGGGDKRWSVTEINRTKATKEKSVLGDHMSGWVGGEESILGENREDFLEEVTCGLRLG